MAKKPIAPGTSSRVTSKTVFRTKKQTPSKRKGQMVTATYAARYPHLVSKEKWMHLHTLRHKLDRKTGKEKTWWVITHRSKLGQVEKIIPVKSFVDRDVQQSLGRSKVYNKIWEHDRGELRITVNGESGGRRIKEVIHLGYLKSAWENQHRGKEKFKDWVVGAILSNLRRRGFRLSNPKESAKRITNLKRKLKGHQDTLATLIEYGDKPEKLGGIMEKIRWTKAAIPEQQKTKQLTKATFRIERLSK